MSERVRIKPGGNYFSAPKKDIAFFSTGCKPLDLALGGGWAEGRIGNIVGDKSTAKTGLAVEASANFALKYPKGLIRYRECESAFDIHYARALGMPIDRIDFGDDPLDTIEDLFEDLGRVVAKAKQPELYIVDSLDALSDRAELEREMDKGTYGAQKAKNLSQMFRRLVRPLNKSRVTLLIISQVRSNIGISFGRDTTRSGGRALDFYASQVVFLARLGSISKTVSGMKRPTGIRIKAKVDKCKVGLPFREADFIVKFGHGVDDVEACRSYLKQAKVPFKEGDPLPTLHKLVENHWWSVEQKLIPDKPKYTF